MQQKTSKSQPMITTEWSFLHSKLWGLFIYLNYYHYLFFPVFSYSGAVPSIRSTMLPVLCCGDKGLFVATFLNVLYCLDARSL